ncbi:RING finger and transmembrane domain-containing protein 2 [Anopheles nili]|uniref:RING finger and transmembrane domain-containing protein 2 n=1 Tax=Anopheles nili TaxID=185578 RepID=UPI00237A41EA|nr:RING finger and transmembrane domain-containing protein 2 [Anopheles nili]
MSDTQVKADTIEQQTERNQQEGLERAEKTTSTLSQEETGTVKATTSTTEEASSVAIIVPTDISRPEGENLPVTDTDLSSVGEVVTSSDSSATGATATQIRCSSVERQTSVGSIDSSTMSAGGGSGSGPSGFRNSLSHGRMFSRFISVDRTRSNSHGTSSRRGSNFSNAVLGDFMTLLQQARHPSSFFSTDRAGLFLNTERSHGSGTSTPPMQTGNSSNLIGNNNANTTTSDVVIDVDDGTGTAGVGSLRSSHNELYPISNSSSSANTSIRPFLWMPSGEDNNPSLVQQTGGRSPLMPNFNYNHHHHHFHNHQPLSLHQSGMGLTSAATTMNAQSPISAGAGEGMPSTSGDSLTNGGIQTPTAGNAPTIGAGGTTRSNSVSSNHQNDEATVHEALNQFPETRALIEALGRYIPLLLILVAKLFYDHIDGIARFMLLLLAFYHANWVVRQEISKQKQQRVIVLLRELIIIIFTLLIFVYEFKRLFLVMLFVPHNFQPESLKSLLFVVCITDLILKLFTIAIKIMVTLLPPRVLDYKCRGKVYLMIESLSQLYRATAPIQPWTIFLFESYSGSEKMFGVILFVVYIVAKATDLLDRIKFCHRSFIKLLQKTSYGTVPTKEQLQACGGQCSICHDNFNSPVLLECNHIFCELCVGTWFDREQTCPLCRAKIVDDPSYRDGATSFFFQLY